MQACDEATRFKGTVSSWSGRDKWGFLDCPELKSDFHSDIFFHLNDFSNPGKIEKGTTFVSFCLDVNTKSGKPQAREVKHEARETKHDDSIDISKEEQRFSVIDEPKIVLPRPGERVTKTTSAVIPFGAEEQHSWSEAKRTGKIFIPSMNGNQSRAAIPMLPSGGVDLRNFVGASTTEPMFDETELMAFHAACMAVESPLTGIDLRQVMSSSSTTLATTAPAPRESVARAIGALPPSDGTQRYQGTILNWNVTKGWGFVVTPDLAHYLPAGSGIFVHFKEFIGIPEGATLGAGLGVSFGYKVDSAGRPHAVSVVLSEQATQVALLTTENQAMQAVRAALQSNVAVTAGTPQLGGSAAAYHGKRLTGKVKSFNVLKAWGFLQSSDLVAVLGASVGVFFHIKDCMNRDQNLPVAGAPVSFTFTVDSKGKPHAIQVVIEGAASDPAEQLAITAGNLDLATSGWQGEGSGAYAAVDASATYGGGEQFVGGTPTDAGGHPTAGYPNGVEWTPSGHEVPTGGTVGHHEQAAHVDGETQGGAKDASNHVDDWSGASYPATGNYDGFAQWTYAQEATGRVDDMAGYSETMRSDLVGSLVAGDGPVQTGDCHDEKQAVATQSQSDPTEQEPEAKKARVHQ
eukprot:TRINITY_DN61305_c0_g1_i1.p1 TRINITY_DN61305_c0_g1~~TRINITY_DN61305_c0_g1_i1.p1  ORF type:complete len:685 (-),score=97.12 TRINITY_DN61305_c0_g1_i1:105-1997(-)